MKKAGDTYIRLMDGTYCHRKELPDYSDEKILIPVLQKRKIIDETEICTSSIIGIYDYYIIYNDHIYFDDGMDEYGENFLTLYNFRYFTTTQCSGNSILWKRGSRPVIVDLEMNEIKSLTGEECYSFDFKIPVGNRYPFVHWEFYGKIDCIATEEDLAIQVRDNWERPESHTLIIHSYNFNNLDKSIGSFEITFDEDAVLSGNLISLDKSEIMIKQFVDSKQKVCIYDLYGNLIYQKDVENMQDTTPKQNVENLREDWISQQNEMSYKVVISLGSCLFVEHKNIKRNFIPIVYNLDGLPDVRALQSRLRSDGLSGDNKPYYVQWYWSLLSDGADLTSCFSSNSYAFEKNDEITEYFESQKYHCIAKSISKFKYSLQPDKKLHVWIPTFTINEEFSINELSKALESHGIRYSVGESLELTESGNQYIVFVVDYETDKQRQIQLTNKVISQSLDNIPFVVIISIKKDLDESDMIYLTATIDLKKERSGIRRQTIINTYYNEETAIMNSLAGRGPDPEVFGF